MGFPTALSAGQKTTLRTSGYWHRTFLALNPGEIVFQARANEAITDTPFKQFAWDGTVSGAYTDVWAGMVVYISSTSTPFKNYKYRGRVRLAPTSSIFYIDLNATTLADGDYITVIRDVDLFARVREDTLVDGSVAYHNLPPMITGLPSVLVLYDSDNDGFVSYTTAQSGIASASGASISSWLHSLSGAGSTAFTSGTSTSQNPTVRFQAGYHYLWRVRVTDSNSVQHYVIIQVYAIARTFTAPVIRPVIAGSVSQDLDNGYTGSVTAYGGVEDLPYRTHAAVFCIERFGDNSSTPIVTNILMHGRLRSEAILTEGSAEAGQLMQVTYPIEGITAYLQRLKVPNDIVRHQSSPDEWGEMVNPTPYRMAVYFLFVYTTLLNIASFSAGDSLFDAWRRGGEPVSIDGGYALDTLNTILSSIDAAVNAAPDGELRCEINASYKVDRSGLVTIMDFLPTDAPSFELNIDTSRQVAQVVGYGGAWNTTNNTFVLYGAQAPSIVYSDAPETREYTRAVLQYDSTTAEAAEELGTRTGNDYAFHNAKWLLSAVLRDSHRWLVATNYQRYTWTIAATENLRELAITTATKWQCQSVGITINPDGTYDTTAEFAQETEFTDAQSVASLLPENLPQLNPVVPVLSDFPAFPDDPVWGYPTDTPATGELQPIDPYSAFLAYSPFTPDQAAQAARKQGTAKCRAFQVLARNSGTTNSPFLTVNTAAYTLLITGSGRIGTNGWSQRFNMRNGLNGWVIQTADAGAAFGQVLAGQGIGTTDVTVSGVNTRGFFIAYGVAIPTLTSVSITLDFTAGGGIPGAVLWDDATPLGFTPSPPPNGTDVSTVYGSALAIASQIGIQVNSSYSAAFGGSALLKEIAMSGTGTNPFTGDPGGNEDADYFYRVFPGDEGSAALFGSTEGGLIDGAKPAVIPAYSPSHEYRIPFTGTGNAIQAAFALASYTNVQNFAFTIQACRD